MIKQCVQFDMHGFVVDPPSPSAFCTQEPVIALRGLYIKFCCRQRRMHIDVHKPTDDHDITDHVRKKRYLLQNCGGLRWNLPRNDVRSKFKFQPKHVCNG